MHCAPKSLTDQHRAEVETLAAVLTAQQMADYFGIGRTTFFAMLDRDPDVAERYKGGAPERWERWRKALWPWPGLAMSRR